MKRLLGQLTDMHDAIEKTQKEAWDVFIRRRQSKLAKASSVHSYSQPVPSPSLEGAVVASGSTGGAAGGTAMGRERSRQSLLGIGVSALMGSANGSKATEETGWSENLVGVAQMGVAGKKGKEDWEEFKMLVRKGIPIAYRPK